MEKIGNQDLVHLSWVSTSLKRSFKVKKTQLTNSLKAVPRVFKKSIESQALLKLPSSRRSPRKRILKEDEYADFISNDTISVFNIIEKN